MIDINEKFHTDMDCFNNSENELSEKNKVKADNIFKSIVKQIETNEWKTTVTDEIERVILLGMSMKNATHKVWINVDKDARSISVNVFLPATCMEEYKVAVLQELNTINIYTRYGKFFLGKEDMDIVYNYTWSIKNGFDCENFVEYLIACMTSADFFYPRLKRLCSGEIEGDEKIKILKNIKLFIEAIN